MSADEQQKLSQEYQDYQKKLEQQKEDYRKEHPDEVYLFSLIFSSSSFLVTFCNVLPGFQTHY